MSNWTVRALRANERLKWEPLWQGYQDFYKAALAPEVTDLTWAHLHDEAEPMHVLGAFGPEGERLVGIVHYIFHRSTWTVGPYCYLQDLFTVQQERGGGIGRALIEAVYAKAREAGASRVWWLTHEDNEPGRLLYDKVAECPGFIQYRKIL